ncbi:MAG: Uma2 family endonuclease [Bacillota bacterium]|nr:Uma2 family endonuclease [Bacillota bacterium]
MSMPLTGLGERETACTYEDYRRLPEGAPYQLIGGELVLTPAPGTYHQVVSMRLGVQMVNFVTAGQRGITLFAPVDVYLGEHETYQPDLVFIARDRLEIIEPERINGAPDLVAEILSPSTAYYDLRKKYKVYEKSGVKEYWIVDPVEKSVQVFVLRDGRFVLDQEVGKDGVACSRLLDGFKVDVESIFTV